MTPTGAVLVSHSGHQHAYETAVAASQAGLLRLFVTGMYWTGTGLTDPCLWRWLPGGFGACVERELRRRRHPELDPARVRVLTAGHHALATLARRAGGRLPGVRDLYLDGSATRRFDRAVARLLGRVDGVAVVHAFEGGSSRTLRAARRAGLSTVLDVPSAHERFVEVEELGWAARLRPEVAIERELADLLLAPSEFVAVCLEQAGVPAERVLRLPYGVDPTIFRPAAENRRGGRFRALFAGQIGHRKGVRYLLEAWRRLALPDAELLLVGPPDSGGRRLLAEYQGSYRWIGAVPGHELRDWFQRSDVFVFPSLAEGSARVTYEAMASGLPLVVTPNSGAVVRDGVDGFVVPPRDVDAICERVGQLHADPEAGRAMGARGRALIEGDYTWAHYHRRLAAIYRALLAGRPVQEIVRVSRQTAPA